MTPWSEDELVKSALEFADKALPFVNHPVRNSMDVANNRCVSLARAYRAMKAEADALRKERDELIQAGKWHEADHEKICVHVASRDIVIAELRAQLAAAEDIVRAAVKLPTNYDKYFWDAWGYFCLAVKKYSSRYPSITPPEQGKSFIVGLKTCQVHPIGCPDYGPHFPHPEGK